ncbi:MAG TPA: ABC transporter ATP-binding protein [Syntrophorhabdaceae bacterium]|nr:ABC transporter ATP-binding protein [Syntrophorhabdaceae bacterium]HNT69326.1 ABC transporter ATP-binding protein [Syntrophorhabdaceae bacterium]
MLSITGISVGYNKIKVLKDFTLQVNEGEVVCLLGANGAGKSTLLRAVSGLLKPNTGNILFNGEEIGGKAPQDIVRKGISHVPEGRQIFSSLSVRQNLLLGTYAHRVAKDGTQKRLRSVFELFPVLEKKLGNRGGDLSGGEQQMLAIGRALMARPKLLLLDEPSLGLAPLVVKNIFQVIKDLRSMGIAILLVEQNARSALQITDRGYIMETGRVVKEGRAGDLLTDDEVRRTYLGK